MKEITFLEHGTKRKGYLKRCVICDKEYPVRKSWHKTSRFCSSKCRNEGNKVERVTISCDTCGKEINRKASSLRAKSNTYFCSRQCKNEAAKLDGGNKKIWPYFYGTGKCSYKKLFKDKKCSRCGYEEFIECIDIHHKDEDHANNEKENLTPLCVNCHRALHMGLWKLET